MISSTVKYILYSVLALLGLLVVALIDSAPPQKPLEVTAANFTKTLQGDQPVLIEFGATWCTVCQEQGPITDELANETPQYRIGKLDVDQHSEIAEQYYVKRFPTMIIFRNSQEVERFIGVQSKKTLKEKLASHEK